MRERRAGSACRAGARRRLASLARLAIAATVALTASGGCGAPHQERPTGGAAAPLLRVWNEPLTGMAFVELPPGRFVMGSPDDEPGREPQERAHAVELTRAFWLGRHEVTQAQWRRVMGTNPSWFAAAGGDHPVERVSWHDVQAFIARLAERTGERFRLPTEAEWEYACRAGTATPFATGANLRADQANYDGRYPYAGHPPGAYRGGTAPVGSYPPNPWGLHDLHGNVWEWTADDHAPYPAPASPGGARIDPSGPTVPGDRWGDRTRNGSRGARAEDARKVIRGGSWAFDANSARCALRYTHRPGDVGYSLGFRLVRVSPG